MDDTSTGSRKWLEDLLRDKCRLASIRPFQLDHGLDLIAGKDIFLVIAPGMGKTLVLCAPLLAAQAQGTSGIAFVIVPTKILTEQQAGVFRSCGLRALAINQDTVRDAYYEGRDLFKELCDSEDIRVGVMTPWMLQSERIQHMLHDVKIRKQLRWIFADEIHLANKEDPSVWLVAYLALLHMRPRLPGHVIWGLLTGTATRLETLKLCTSLGFLKGHYVNARYSVDRPNIKYIPRFCEHPVSGNEFLDLSFLIPIDMKYAHDIPSTLIFCESIQLGWRVMQFLDSLIPLCIPNRKQLVKLINALMPSGYRTRMKDDMESGTVRIGICTDTCNYGLDIRNISVVVTFGQCSVYSKLKQQWCRGGRNGSPAVAYAFAPPWVRHLPFYEIQRKQQKDDEERREKLPNVIVDWFNASATRCPRQVDLAYNDEDYTLSERCCSLHHPEPEESRDRAMVARWQAHMEKNITPKERAPRSDGTHRVLEPHMKEAVVRMLEYWRTRMWISIRPPEKDLPSNIFLPTRIITRLTEKLHVCTSMDRLHQVIGEWEYFDQHGQALLELVSELLKGFGNIFEERGAIAGDADEQDIQEIQQEFGVQSQTQPRVRLLLGPKIENTLQETKIKRSISPLPAESVNTPVKRPRITITMNGKENKYASTSQTRV